MVAIKKSCNDDDGDDDDNDENNKNNSNLIPSLCKFWYNIYNYRN